MARMHARKKGKASSKKVFHAQNPEWVELSGAEVEELVVKLAKQNMTAANIGTVLRDEYGVPDVRLATGKKLQKILQANKMAPQIPEDLMSLLQTSVRMHDHLKHNRKDLHNLRMLHLTEAKIRRLVRYYTKTQKLPSGWTYSYQAAKLLAE